MSNSDYNKRRTNLFQLLPEVYQSGVNESILETTFNRFLTKSELTRVIGYIGQGNPNAIVNRQIQEATSHRQAFQLQPVMFNRIGTIEHMSTWEDIQSEIKRLGVDTDKMQEWGKALSFNWAPPIDYDKLLNYRDYYWYNPDNIADQPQYVQIQNPCTRAEAKVDEYQNTLDEFGITHPIVGLDAPNSNFTINDDLVAIFTEGFIFYVKDSTNSTINNEFFTVSSSTLNQFGQTVITANVSGSPLPYDDSIVDGNISLEELSFVFDSERDCLCNGTVGWGGGLWDDNQIGDILWNTQLLSDITHPTEASWITANGGSPTANSLWYDTTTNELKQDQGTLNWIVVQSNFNELIAATTGGNLWDLTTACGIESNPWIAENRWLHKNQVPNFTLAKQAQIPIIEFLSTVDLNEWAETIYQWQYRTNPITESFTDTTVFPNLFELTGIDTYTFPVSSPMGEDILFNSNYGDLTSVFVPGYQFKIIDSSTLTMNTTYTVAHSLYCEDTAGTKYQTRVTISGTFSAAVNDGMLIPVKTSLGDPYFGLHEHWVFVGVIESRPISKQPINPMLAISDNPPPVSIPFGFSSPVVNSYGDYVLGLYAQEITLSSDSFGLIDIVGVSTGSPSSTWTLNGDHTAMFNELLLGVIGGKIHISGNTGGGANGEYTVLTATLYAGNTNVVVAETIPANATVTGSAYVEWILPFDESLKNITLYEANELRVYIDNVRQYGTYDEINTGSATGSPIYASPLAHATCDDFVNSIRIKTPVSNFGIIRIEVGAAAPVDLGLENVPVRMDTNDMTFNSVLPLPCVNLVRYRKLEQIKTITNQYPLFDLFDVEGNTINIASRVFAFQESQDASVDVFFGKRIVHSTDRREYYYEQFLLDQDNGTLFTYRDNSISGAFWFETDNQILYRWTGDTWDSKIITTTYASGSPLPETCYLTPIVSDIAPGTPWINIDGMIWFNTFNNTINVSDGSSWNQDTFLTAATTVAAADPTLISIWRTGPDDVSCEQRETYIPNYVDKDRNIVSIGDVDGDWEIPDQLYFNISHQNKKVLSQSELLAHFLSVIEEQDIPAGFFGTSQQMFHVLTDVNFGKGGTIKEYNQSYDSFLSSIFIQNVNPLTLYEYAHDAYENALNQIKESFRKDIEGLMTDTSESAIADLSGDLTNDIIEQYEQNDFSSFVYGDSNTYIQETDTGVKNWPATLPFIRMAFKVLPQIFRDEELNLNELLHHDGHLSTVRFTATAVNGFNLRIIRAEDVRTSNPSGLWGAASSSTPPATFSVYETQFGKTAGCYWYHIVPSSRILYRMNVVRVSVTLSEPPTTLPLGSYWYNTTEDRLKVLAQTGSPSTLKWVNATTATGVLIEGNVSAWKVINIDYLLSDVLLNIETRLYEAAPDLTELAFDLDSTFLNNQALADDLIEQEFFSFISQVEILDPFENDDYDSQDKFTWNYKSSTQVGSPIFTPQIGNVYVSGGTWQDVYKKNYGTPYPHLEPWVMQGYRSKPSWWDNGNQTTSPITPYKDITGSRRWTSGMWSNILSGVVPVGELLPNGLTSAGTVGEVQKYNYVSVNIDSISHGGYNPDELFPPLWEPPTIFIPVDFITSKVRSIFISEVLEIVDSDADYVYDDSGKVEWRWENATQYLYDLLKVAFKISPVEFIYKTLGERFLEIGCLQVSQRTQNVYAHQNALFHGDLLSDDTILKFPGTLQWYTNFNRFNGYDSSSSNFRSMWTGWNTPLGYQFSTFVDTESFLVFNKNFDITDQDYQIRIKRSPGIEDHWVDALNIQLLKSPPSLIRFDTEDQWEFLFNSFSPIGRPLPYYANHSYGFSVNLTGSPMTTVSSVMTISDPYGRSLPWNTGDAVIVFSSQYLPSPLLPNTFYYIVKVSSTEFSLSEQPNGPVITMLSTGVGDHTVAQVARSFTALNGQTTDKIWYAYAQDKNITLSINLPTRIVGIQNLINIVYGYAAYEENVENFSFNHEAIDIDPDTGRVIDWQLEIERFIDFAYNARTTIQARQDSYKFTAEDSPLLLKFEKQTEVNTQGQVVEKIAKPQWFNGQQVIIFPDTGSALPEPLLPNIPYYFFAVSEQDFKLAVTRRNATHGIGIDLTSTGSGDLYVQEFVSIVNNPFFEMNPFRNNIWLNTSMGVMSDIVLGPFSDVRTDQIVFDQYGRKLPTNKVLALRQDTQSRIQISDEIPNDIDKDFSLIPDTYNYLHLTSAHLYVDGYEHVLLFNNYASNGALIYDSFLGLNTPRFDVQFDRGEEFTLRPNVGGYVLLNKQDTDFTSNLIRNMEGQTEDMRFMYNTYKGIESNNLVSEGRDSLGYDGPFYFLNAININPKSQFIFWRGMIQSKGSVNSVNAFINSRRFVDARIDEFWAYKIAEFGDSREYNLPEINLFTSDTRVGEIRFHFVEPTEEADTGFIAVTNTNQDRWYEYPNQQEFFASNGNMFFNVKLELFQPRSADAFEVASGTYTHVYVLPYPIDGVVIYNSITGLLVSDAYYDLINSRTIGFTMGLPYDAGNKEYDIYVTLPYESKHNPAKIRDVIEELTISEAILWDPARDNHYHNAIHLVDVKRDTDPVNNTVIDGSPEAFENRYEFQVNLSSGEPEEVFADDYDPWGKKEVGTTWLDTNELGYVPYSDAIINPDVFDRLKAWGRLSDWASYRIYQWTESDIPPFEYDSVAATEEGDFSIDEQIRKSGTTRKEIWKLVPSGSPIGSPEVNVWIPYYFEKYSIGSKVYYSTSDITFDVSVDEPATLYKNGEIIGTFTLVGDIATAVATFTDNDFIDVVKYQPTPDGETYKEVTPYSTEIVIENDIPITKYYFWVENKSVPEKTRGKTLSMLEAVQQLETIPIPYVVPQNLENAVTRTFTSNFPDIGSPLESPVGSPIGSLLETEELLPQRYTQAILRNYGSLINADDRYVLRFTRNFVLRDDLRYTNDGDLLKTIHQEWELFRKEQQFNVPQGLWNLIIESVIGQTLASLGGTAVRVPSLDRELFDIENNTSTRIGIAQSGQAFCVGENAWAAVLQYLQDGDNDFAPIDIQTFFTNHDILNLTPRIPSDAQAINDALTEIYNTFKFENVNRIFFSVLNTAALPLQSKYQDLFKTSWVALHGIKVLEVNGIFSD